jgi:proliferating cell nuclear antigen
MDLELTNFAKLDCFAQIFQHLKIFTELVNIQFLETGILVQGLDSSHVSIFVISIPGIWFDNYHSRGVSLGFNTHIFCKILFAREKTQKLRMQLDSNNEDVLFISFTGASAGATDGVTTGAAAGVFSGSIEFDRNFEMNLVEVNSEMLEIPVIEYSAEFSLLSGKFNAVVNQLKNFGDTMDICCTEEKIKLDATSPCTGKMSVDIKIEELLAYTIDEDTTLTALYSLQYITNICQFHKVSKEIQISLSPDYPMQFEYSMGEGAFMKFYLAPKMSDD